MTTAPAVQAPQAMPGSRAGFGHFLLSEWTKLRSVRSTMWTLLLLVVLTLGLTGLITGLTMGQWSKIGPASQAQLIGDPVSAILGASVEFGQLTIIVLGVMSITSEYTTGAIRSSLLAVPRRGQMLAAKALMFTMVVRLDDKLRVSPSPALLGDLKQLLGPACVG